MVIETMSENCEFPVLPLNDSPISEFIDILVRLVTKGSLLPYKMFVVAVASILVYLYIYLSVSTGNSLQIAAPTLTLYREALLLSI